MVYRIVQELLHNSLKHAQAHRIEIVLHRDTQPAQLHLRYTDDGR
ncbi:MAG TPA: two-component sensor histidine kinase, partial [Cytophagales bacterium]|nr:two-component sensor histidine kinase [Cytophagales bacterium]